MGPPGCMYLVAEFERYFHLQTSFEQAVENPCRLGFSAAADTFAFSRLQVRATTASVRLRSENGCVSHAWRRLRKPQPWVRGQRNRRVAPARIRFASAIQFPGHVRNRPGSGLLRSLSGVRSIVVKESIHTCVWAEKALTCIVISNIDCACILQGVPMSAQSFDEPMKFSAWDMVGLTLRTAWANAWLFLKWGWLPLGMLCVNLALQQEAFETASQPPGMRTLFLFLYSLVAMVVYVPFSIRIFRYLHLGETLVSPAGGTVVRRPNVAVHLEDSACVYAGHALGHTVWSALYDGNERSRQWIRPERNTHARAGFCLADGVHGGGIWLHIFRHVREVRSGRAWRVHGQGNVDQEHRQFGLPRQDKHLLHVYYSLVPSLVPRPGRVLLRHVFATPGRVVEVGS